MSFRSTHRRSRPAVRATLALALPVAMVAACMPPRAPELPASSAGPWVNLLPGDASHWRGYKRTDLPDGWRFDASSGVLERVGPGGDIITTGQWGDFELELEWRVGLGGNSGVFYRATEETDVIYMNAPEMQILDNNGHRDGQNALTSTGSNYALHAPSEAAAKPVGEWNKVRIVAVGPHVEHWLNGKKVVEYEQGSPEWAALVKASKFDQWPAYGRAMRGHIGLQDHGDRVAFRNIRIRELRP